MCMLGAADKPLWICLHVLEGSSWHGRKEVLNYTHRGELNATVD